MTSNTSPPTIGNSYLHQLLSKDSSEYIKSTCLKAHPTSFIKISGDKLTISYEESSHGPSETYSVKANNPVNRDVLIAYFEVTIQSITSEREIVIGLSDVNFPFNKRPGFTKKHRAMGYVGTGRASAGKHDSELSVPPMAVGDIIGCGLNYVTGELFYTHNGVYYGPAFKKIDLRAWYPTISLSRPGDRVSVNFGRTPFKFDLDSLTESMKVGVIDEISRVKIDPYDVHMVVQSYLLHGGFADSMDSFNQESHLPRINATLEKEPIVKLKTPLKKEETADARSKRYKNQLLAFLMTRAKHSLLLPLLRRVAEEEKEDSNEDGDTATQRPTFVNSLAEALAIDDFEFSRDHEDGEDGDMNSEEVELPNLPQNKPNSSEILMMKPEKPNSSPSMADLEEGPIEESNDPDPSKFYARGTLRKMIIQGEVEEALAYLSENFPGVADDFGLTPNLQLLRFLTLISEGNITSAVEYAENNFTVYQGKPVFWTINSDNQEGTASIDDIMGILCYPDPMQSEFKGLFTLQHRDMIASRLNSAILKNLRYSQRSKVDTLLGQLMQIERKTRDLNHQYGSIFQFKV